MSTSTPAAIWGSRPMVANSEVPIANPPMANANRAAPGRSRDPRAGRSAVRMVEVTARLFPGGTIRGVRGDGCDNRAFVDCSEPLGVVGAT